MDNFHQNLKAKEKAMNDFKIEHKIRIMGEDVDEADVEKEQQQRAQEQQSKREQGVGAGVLV